MSRVKLGDVAFERKETLKNNTGYPTVGLEHIIPEEIELINWDEGAENTFTKVFHAGDVLFGRRRAYLKKAALAPIDGICSGDITVISAIEDKICPRLLPFIIQNDKFFDFAVEKSAGSLSPRVKWQHAKEFEFELPEMEQQEKLAELLWAVNDTKTAYKKLQKQTDELVKSQFIEMFGDPDTNSKGLPIAKLPDLGENLDNKRIPITGGDRKKGEYPYYGASGVVDYVADYIFDDDLLLISEDGANLVARVTPIAFSSTGKVWINNHAHVIKFKSMAMQCYVENLLNIMDISSYVTGTAQPKLNQAKLNSIPIPVPEEEQIREYLAFVKQSDKSKFELEQSIAELTATYKRIITDNLG